MELDLKKCHIDVTLVSKDSRAYQLTVCAFYDASELCVPMTHQNLTQGSRKALRWLLMNGHVSVAKQGSVLNCQTGSLYSFIVVKSTPRSRSVLLELYLRSSPRLGLGCVGNVIELAAFTNERTILIRSFCCHFTLVLLMRVSARAVWKYASSTCVVVRLSLLFIITEEDFLITPRLGMYC